MNVGTLSIHINFFFILFIYFLSGLRAFLHLHKTLDRFHITQFKIAAAIWRSEPVRMCTWISTKCIHYHTFEPSSVKERAANISVIVKERANDTADLDSRVLLLPTLNKHIHHFRPSFYLFFPSSPPRNLFTLQPMHLKIYRPLYLLQ